MRVLQFLCYSKEPANIVDGAVYSQKDIEEIQCAGFVVVRTKVASYSGQHWHQHRWEHRREHKYLKTYLFEALRTEEASNKTEEIYRGLRARPSRLRRERFCLLSAIFESIIRISNFTYNLWHQRFWSTSDSIHRDHLVRPWVAIMDNCQSFSSKPKWIECQSLMCLMARRDIETLFERDWGCHSHWKLTVLKSVLRLKYCLSALYIGSLQMSHTGLLVSLRNVLLVFRKAILGLIRLT